MKKLIPVLLILCACVLLLTACQSGEPAAPAEKEQPAAAVTEAAQPAAEKSDNKVLNVMIYFYNLGSVSFRVVFRLIEVVIILIVGVHLALQKCIPS